MNSPNGATEKMRHQNIREVMKSFPFPGYMETKWHAYNSIAGNCQTLLPEGARILDFGAGPAEKVAVLNRLGYQCTAVDDLEDDWHQIGNNRDKLREFARSERVEFYVADHVPAEIRQTSFDMIMLHDIIEHFADSPRALLVDLIDLLRPGGYLYITVPNAVNLRKRLLVLTGQTNYPRYAAYFWSGNTWRGHKREYVKDDLAQLCEYLGLRPVLLKGQHHRMRAIPRAARPFYLSTVGRIDSLRDTVALIGQKPPDWTAPEITDEQYKVIRQKETTYHFD
jgi:SAM-dependent methyltransferase